MSVQLPLSFRMAIREKFLMPSRESRAQEFLEIVLEDRQEAIGLVPARGGLVPGDGRGCWTARSTDEFQGSGQAWSARWQSIPARVISDFGHRLAFLPERGTGEWVFRHHAASFHPETGFEYQIEIRLDPAGRTFDVRESFLRLAAE